MADIKFVCRFCNQPLEAPPDMVGEIIECPNCRKQITIPMMTRQVRVPSPVISPLHPSSNPERSKPGMSGSRKAAIGIALVCLLYIVSPYFSIWRLYSAMQAEDAEGISARIDFPSLRVSLKDQVNAQVMRNIASNKDLDENPFAGLAAAFLPKMVESMVDAYVTPAGVSMLFAMAPPASAPAKKVPSTPKAEKLQSIKYAFFSSPTSFLVKGEDIKVIFRIKDWTWKLSEVTLTQSSLGRMGDKMWDGTESPKVAQTDDEDNTPSDPMPTPKPPAWEYSSSVSPIDDSTSHFLRHAAQEPVGSGFMSSLPTLLIRHKEGELEIFVNFDTYLGIGDEASVTVRLGSSPARQEAWGLSSDGKAVFCPHDSYAFLNELMRNDKLVMRLTPIAGNPVTATFDLAGLADAIKPMKAVLRQ